MFMNMLHTLLFAEFVNAADFKGSSPNSRLAERKEENISVKEPSYRCRSDGRALYDLAIAFSSLINLHRMARMLDAVLYHKG